MVDTKENTCLHCGSKKAKYCEECYQRLLAENITLRFTLKGLLREPKEQPVGLWKRRE